MYELKKNGKVFTSKFIGTEPSSYEKRIYRAAVSQRLRSAGLVDVSVFVCKGQRVNPLWRAQSAHMKTETSVLRNIVFLVWDEWAIFKMWVTPVTVHRSLKKAVTRRSVIAETRQRYGIYGGEWHFESSFSEYFCLPLSVSFRHYRLLFHLSQIL